MSALPSINSLQTAVRSLIPLPPIEQNSDTRVECSCLPDMKKKEDDEKTISISLPSIINQQIIDGYGSKYLGNGKHYLGLFEQGVFHGIGYIMNKEGIIEFEGNFVQGLKQSGQELIDKYSKFLGIYKKGIRYYGYIIDQKTEIILYHGRFENNAPVKFSKEIWPPSSSKEAANSYTGEKKEGKKHGFGCDRNKNGDVSHYGFYKNGMKHGFGKTTKPGLVFTGLFYRGSRNGFGILTCKGHKELHANFKKGIPQTGFESYDSNTKFIGSYKDGKKLDGVLTDIQSGKIIYRGFFENERPIGKITK